MDLQFSSERKFAQSLDKKDKLKKFRKEFCFPQFPKGKKIIYFSGNSQGLMPKSTEKIIREELKQWADYGVHGHLRGKRPWYAYQKNIIKESAVLAGANENEVVHMNSLTVNLHLMFTTFYRPTAERHKILIEDFAFPSDRYAVMSHLKLHGYSPEDALLVLKPRANEYCIRMEDMDKFLNERGKEIAVVWLPGVQYYTGQVFDMKRITAMAHAQGCIAGFDLAHAVGNIPLQLHEWDADFAVWCTYKYLNANSGGAGGCFIHQRHAENISLLRLGGWFGNDPATRFTMPFDFVPHKSASGWMISNEPVLSLATLMASLKIFQKAGMKNIREESLLLTGYLEFLLEKVMPDGCRIITPKNPEERGCQLSLMIPQHANEIQKQLKEQGVVCDFRSPDVIRVAPVPLYNTFEEVWAFAEIFKKVTRQLYPTLAGE